jgi:hypothetical protein
MCDYRENARKPDPAPKARSRLLAWLERHYILAGVIVGAAVPAMIGLAAFGFGAFASHAKPGTTPAPCVDEAFVVPSHTELTRTFACASPLARMEIDAQHGWITCHCDAMNALREAWTQDLNERVEHMEKWLKLDDQRVRDNDSPDALDQRLQVVAMEFRAIHDSIAKLRASRDVLADEVAALDHAQLQNRPLGEAKAKKDKK